MTTDLVLVELAAWGVREMERLMTRFDVEIRWCWGGHDGAPFRETEHVTVSDRSEVDRVIREFIPRMVATYGYDCGRPYMPLDPHISSIVVTPIGERDYRRAAEYESLITEAMAHERARLETRGAEGAET